MSAGVTGEASRYSVSIGGEAISVQSIQLKGGTTVVLGLDERCLKAGRKAVVTYRIQDTEVRILQGRIPCERALNFLR